MVRVLISSILITIIVGVFVALYLIHDSYSRQLNAKNYSPVNGVILDFKNEIHGGLGPGGGRSYLPYFRKREIIFKYSIDGEELISNKWSFFFTEAHPLNIRSYDLSHSKGDTITVHYDPKNPSIAIVDKSTPDKYLYYGTMVFISCCLAFMIYFTFHFLKPPPTFGVSPFAELRLPSRRK